MFIKIFNYLFMRDQECVQGMYVEFNYLILVLAVDSRDFAMNVIKNLENGFSTISMSQSKRTQSGFITYSVSVERHYSIPFNIIYHFP